MPNPVVEYGVSPDTSRGLSASIWQNCPRDRYKEFEGGFFMYDDFLNFPDLEDWGASAGLQDVGSGYFALLDDSCNIKQLGTLPGGEITPLGGVICFDGASAQDDWMALTIGSNAGALARITDTAGSNKKVWFETRIAFSDIDELHSFYCGLIEAAGLSDTFLATDGTGVHGKDVVGFQVLEADVDGLDCIHNTAAGAAAEVVVVDVAHVIVPFYWVKVGLYFDGTATRWYINGTIKPPDTAPGSGPKDGVIPAATKFPNGDWLAPCWMFRVGDTSTANFYVDWWAMAGEI